MAQSYCTAISNNPFSRHLPYSCTQTAYHPQIAHRVNNRPRIQNRYPLLPLPKLKLMVTRVTRIKTDRKKTIFSYLLSLLPVFSVTKLQAAQTYHCCEGKSCFICVELKAGEGIYSPPKGFPFAETRQNSVFSCNNSISHGSGPSVRFPDTKNPPSLSSVAANGGPCAISHFER